MNDLVSILITTFNRAKLLERSLSYVLKQENVLYEIIIVDDNSADNTEYFVKNFIDLYPNISINYIKNSSNRGNAFSRNVGLEQCKGSYIAFLDDDDYWIDSKKLVKQINFLKNNPRFFAVCSSVLLIKEDQNLEKKINLNKYPRSYFLKRNNVIYSPTFLMKNLVKEYSLCFDIKLKKGVDSDFYRTLMFKHKLIIGAIEDVTTAVYEIGIDRMTVSFTKKNYILFINQQFYILRKYFRFYLLSPSSFIYRIKKILKFIFFFYFYDFFKK